MSRLVLVASNLGTAALTALVTSMYWVGAYGSDETRPPSASASTTPVTPAPFVAQDEPLRFGPTGVAIPVLGIKPRQLRDTYSQARAGGRRVHDAIDIMAAAGTPVVAAAPGMVEKLYYSNGGGGIAVYARSTDGRWSYYYAHLQKYAPGLKEGQKLRQGDPVGFVGSTGNAGAAGPHLHFAIHRMKAGERWWQGVPINPYPLLAGKGSAP